VIADKIRSEIPPVDIAEVMAEIEALLDQSIGAEGYAMPPVADPDRYVDLSQIDFEALRDKFDVGRNRIDARSRKYPCPPEKRPVIVEAMRRLGMI